MPGANIRRNSTRWAREAIVEVEAPEVGPMLMQGIVPKLSGSPGEVRWTGPALGQHNDEVFGGILGLSGEKLADLKERRVI